MRFRFVLFALIAAFIPPAMAFIITADVGVRAEQTLDRRVDTASKALVAKLEADTEKRRERLLQLVALPDVADLVRVAAKSDAVPPADAVAKVRAAVNNIFPTTEVPQLVAIVNQAGAQVVVSSSEPKSYPVEKLSSAAAAALSGEMASTYTRFEGDFYRLTAAPVGISDGAIVLGDRIGESTAVVRLRDEVGADVTFVVGGKPAVSTFRDPNVRQEVAEAARVSPSTRSSGKLELSIPGGHFLGHIFPIAIPSAERLSLAREIPGKVFAVVTLKSDLGWVGNMQAIGVALGLGLLLIGFIWIPAIYGPVYRQARSIEAHLARLRLERSLRLTTKGFSPPFTAIAELLDKLADDWGKETPAPIREPSPLPPIEAPKPIQRPPVELPLSTVATPKPTVDEGTSASFPFADDPRVITGRQQKEKSGPAVAPKEPTPAVKETPRPPPPAPRPEPAPVQVKPELPKSIPPAPPPKPEPRVAAVMPLSATGELSGPIPLPGSGSTAPRNGVPKQATETAVKVVPPPPPPKPAAAVSESDIPPELLARSQELERELMGGGPSDADEEHYHAVFEEFLTVRRRCGEANEGLTYDKFSARLKKNREQLVEKYACRTVRFQVYVKDGKAAVKAVPVR